MSAPDQKKVSQPFKVGLDDLNSLSIPDDHDLNSDGFGAPPVRNALDPQHSSSLSANAPSSLINSIETESETILDTIAEGIDNTVKGFADKLKKLDQKLTSMLNGDEEIDLPKSTQRLRKKVRRKKTIAGKEVEIEEYEEQEVVLPRLEDPR